MFVDHQMFRLRTETMNSTGSANQAIPVTELILADEGFTDFQLDKHSSSSPIRKSLIGTPHKNCGHP